jgi:hypothetical protein
MIALELSFFAQSHYSQHACHRAFSRRKDRAHHQYRHPIPGAFTEYWRKGLHQNHNLCGQGKHLDLLVMI